MKIIKSDNGFPHAWKAGRVEHLIRSILEQHAQRQLSVKRVMIINPTWLHENNITDEIRTANPDFIICHNFVDPAVPKIFEAIKWSGVPYVIIGNSNQYRIDFWAMVCDLYFQDYTEEELQLSPTARKFICLNRKPHPHRVHLVNQLIAAGLKEQGYVSLGLPGEQALTVDTAFNNEQGISDEYSHLGTEGTFVSGAIRNDIFSLGDLEVWCDSFLCLVTETEFNNANPDDFFISEKTWKPVIGMRPFFVYGQAPLRDYLKQQGFDIFEDIFDYTLADRYNSLDSYANIAIEAINRASVDDYAKYQARCKRNKYRFESYVYEQWNKLHRLNLLEYFG